MLGKTNIECVEYQMKLFLSFVFATSLNTETSVAIKLQEIVEISHKIEHA